MNKMAGILGLAQRAGKVVSGGNAGRTAIQNRTAKLAIIASDTEEETKKRYLDWCRNANVKWVIYGQKEELGAWLGKSARSLVIITEQGFAEAMINTLEGEPMSIR